MRCTRSWTTRGRQRGRPRTKGARIDTPAELAAAGPGPTAPVTRYGTTARVTICERRCLWPGVFRSRPVRVIAVTEPGRRLVLVTIDMATPPGRSSPVTPAAGPSRSRWSRQSTRKPQSTQQTRPSACGYADQAGL
jgi:hypothetical protein